MVRQMNPKDYYYKGYDVSNKNRLERLFYEYNNPYGYNLSSNKRRIQDKDKKCIQTNQDFVKNKEFNVKNS